VMDRSALALVEVKTSMLLILVLEKPLLMTEITLLLSPSSFGWLLMTLQIMPGSGQT